MCTRVLLRTAYNEDARILFKTLISQHIATEPDICTRYGSRETIMREYTTVGVNDIAFDIIMMVYTRVSHRLR